MTDMTQYACGDLVVGAAQIDTVSPQANSVDLTFTGNVPEPISTNLEWAATNSPQSGGYFVRYPDGYEAYLTAQAFERTFTLVS